MRTTRATAVHLAALLAGAGCGSGSLPPPLTTAEQDRWRAGRSELAHRTVGVEPYHWHAYSDSLLRGLRGTGLFADVRPLRDYRTAPDLIARVETPDNGGVATIPIWTALTLGVVPTVVRESVNYDFSLRPPGDTRGWRVLSEVPTTTTLGWVALVELLSPDYSWYDPASNERCRCRLALTILDRLEKPPVTEPAAEPPGSD